MKLERVTITGADDSTDINTLIELSKKYPFVEWGILQSLNRNGTDRYPSHKWLTSFLREVTKEKLRVSFHLCGRHTRQIFDEGDYSSVEMFTMLAAPIEARIQLNFNIARSLTTWSFVEFEQFMTANKTQHYILQYNQVNAEFNKLVISAELTNCQFLYDASGGRGKVINKFEQPIENHFTGYAGGLTPENLEQALKDLDAAIPKEAVIWIDTESGVRTNEDKLDLDKVEQFLKIASIYV